jgi:hypothetical protein
VQWLHSLEYAKEEYLSVLRMVGTIDSKHLGPWLVLVINDNVRLLVTNVCFA